MDSYKVLDGPKEVFKGTFEECKKWVDDHTPKGSLTYGGFEVEEA